MPKINGDVCEAHPAKKLPTWVVRSSMILCESGAFRLPKYSFSFFESPNSRRKKKTWPGRIEQATSTQWRRHFTSRLPKQMALSWKIQHVMLGHQYIQLTASSLFYCRGAQIYTTCSSRDDLADEPHIGVNTANAARSPPLFNLIKAIVHAYLGDTNHSS